MNREHDHFITVGLSEAQLHKLEALAASRSTGNNVKSPEQCIRDMIDASQPGGIGCWRHPGDKREVSA